MTDKVQLTKEEIERRIEMYKGLKPVGDQFYLGLISAAKGILQFIDSLPEEHDEDLEEAMELSIADEPVIEFFATGQPTIGAYNKDSLRNQFEAGAEWQHGKDFDDLFQSEIEFPKEFYEKGRADMREEMMKNTVLETKVMMDCDGDGIETPYEEWLTLEDTEIPYIQDNLGLKEGDKVKIIIVKEEQQ